MSPCFWFWLSYSVNLVFQFSSLEDIWKIVDKSWSPQCKILITSSLINVLNTIWYVRNQARFNHKTIPWKSAVSMIIASFSLSGNSTSKTSNNSIRDFTILKTFFCVIHQPKPQVIKEVIWHPPLVNWIKCNIDGTSQGNPGSSAAEVFLGTIMLIFFIVSMNLWELAILTVLNCVLL